MSLARSASGVPATMCAVPVRAQTVREQPERTRLGTRLSSLNEIHRLSAHARNRRELGLTHPATSAQNRQQRGECLTSAGYFSCHQFSLEQVLRIAACWC